MAPYELLPTSLSVGHKTDAAFYDHEVQYVHVQISETKLLVSFVSVVPTRLQRVLDVEHGGPVTVHHVLLNFIFGNVAPSVFYPDACLQVVEVATIELKEFNKQDANVNVGARHVLPVVQLLHRRINPMFMTGVFSEKIIIFSL